MDNPDDEPNIICICGQGPANGPPGSESGDPMTEEGKCPRCGAEPISGYGLAFGGMGIYHFCSSDNCGWYWKLQDAE